jgi:D-beta-D-heptose 7-phosphate kinase/D-beta-D-heptose 1-phosphate adenosyltransferase
VDEETRSFISSETAAQILEFSAAVMGDVHGAVISDYAKGALPPSLLQKLIEVARSAGKPVFVDPKGRDWSRYRGATVLTPNAVEAEAALGIPFSVFDSTSEGGWEDTVRHQVKDLSLDALLITRGAEGVSLVDSHGFHHFPTSTREVFDVTGAGDTMLAAFSLAACSGADYPVAAQFGNLAAGVAVGKAGAAVVYPFEIERELGVRHLSADAKIRTLDQMTVITEDLRWKNKKIVFTNGCFDLLHAGHIYLLREAKKFGDIMIVGLNSDASVRKLKGGTRPIISAEDRAYAIAALECVDYLVVFEEMNPMELIQRIRPDVLAKGGDYSESEVVGNEFVKSYGGVTRVIPLGQAISTTKLVQRIRAAVTA